MTRAERVCDSCGSELLGHTGACGVCQQVNDFDSGTPEVATTGEDHDIPPLTITPPHQPHRSEGQGGQPTEEGGPAKDRMWRDPTPAQWRQAGLVAAAVGAVAAVTTGLSQVVGGPGLPEPEAENVASEAAPCPAEVARFLPGGGAGSDLIASYTTTTHEVTLCRDAYGQAHYDGRRRGLPATGQTHISLPAEEFRSGFLAVNSSHSYQVTGSELVVKQGGQELMRQPLTRTA